jgi:4-hydroxybenzoate polyprenyltransferase
MSRVDRIKEALSWLRLVFGTLVLIDVSLIAWLAQNFRTGDVVLVTLAVVVVAAVTTGVIVVNHAASRRIAELETL